MTKSQNQNSGSREIPVKEVNEFSVGDDELLRQRIDEKAHELYECRGCCHVRGLDDWFEAERLVLSEIGAQSPEKGKNPRPRGQQSKKG
ncbi:MAG: DUF2934 domain-containing protein [Candidatus Binatia bacterium]|nr:DUF2934 domain-containing protein [Candidatus Binatia bacterium]